MNRYTLPSIQSQADTVILANGLFPTHPLALQLLATCNYLVCCDGAVNNLSLTNKLPDAIVGDCDSLSLENQTRFADIIHRVTDQETNDLTKAVNFCVANGKTSIIILGATGKREDHTIANISLLCEYMKIADVQIISDFGIFRAIDTPSTFESEKEQQVSLFCIDPCNVTSHNLMYPITNKRFTNWWQATLNESEGNEFTIDTDGRMIIYRAWK